MESNVFWCGYPFLSVHTDGITARPCCVYTPKNQIPLDGYFENEEIVSTRQHLLNGIAPPQCVKCVNSEKTVGHSFRTMSNKFEYQKEKQNYSLNSKSVQHLFLISSNVCNLKCLPCTNSSYVRELELHSLKLVNFTPTLRTPKLDNLLKFDFKKITISGGEPFYDKKSLDFLQKLSKENRSKDIEIDINTNLTNITDNLLDFLLENFKSVQLKGSLDGVGATNDYLRYPSEWHVLEKSVDKILSRKSIEFCLTTALSNLSLLHFYKLLTWGLERNIRNHYISTVFNPDVLAVHKLPVKIKQQLLPYYIDIKNNLDHTYFDRTAEAVDICINSCYNNTDTEPSELINYLKAHDALRKTDFLSVFPELQEFV